MVSFENYLQIVFIIKLTIMFNLFYSKYKILEDVLFFLQLTYKRESKKY